MNADNWNKIFNYYWEYLTLPDERDFCKKLCTVCLKPSIDLICSDEIATSDLINYIESQDHMYWVGELTKLSEKYADLDKSYELFEELTMNVGYFKLKFPTNRHEWKTKYSFEKCPEPDWIKTEIESAINKYLALNIRHPMLDRILLRAVADFEVCSTMRDINNNIGGKSHLENEESFLFTSGLQLSVLFCLFVSFMSIIYFVTTDTEWGVGLVISLVAFAYILNVSSLNSIRRMFMAKMMLKSSNSNPWSLGPFNSLLAGEKLLYEAAYHSGFISVERLYTSFEEASALGVAVEQDVWALLSDIKSRETILPNL